jgi:hypothetical protein
MSEINLFVIGLLKSNNIDIKDNKNSSYIIKKISSYIDALIYNIITIASIISILNGDKCIKKENLNIIKNYIEDRCSIKYKKRNSMTGGTFNTAEFYGINEPMYKPENQGGDILGIDWSKGIIRPQIGGSTKSKSKDIKKCISYKFIKTHVKRILKYHNITASSKILEELIDIIDHHIICLVKSIKSCGKTLNIKCIEAVVNKSKILAPLK